MKILQNKARPQEKRNVTDSDPEMTQYLAFKERVLE